MIRKQKPLWLVKILHFEYWTWWLFYLPLFPWYLWQAIKAKSFTFFTNVDPCIEYGGFFGESKMNILDKIDKNYLPKSIFVKKNQLFDTVLTQFAEANLNYPIICKPNVGERGNNVEKVINQDQLQEYFNQNFDYIMQEYIDYNIELGVLYYRLPTNKKGTITSITRKAFLEVKGDGESTIEKLMQKSDRARFQIEVMNQKLGNNINLILPKNENLLLEPIGNHCRGTTFLDNNYLINNKLNEVFDKIATQIEGFHYGRFDLRVDTIENLYSGKNIKIMELNGVSADPGHIYDPNYELVKAYTDVAKHWSILADISIAQQKLGIKPIPLKILWPIVKEHFFI
jgi:hypothetical protein